MAVDMTVEPMSWDEAYRIPRMTDAEAKASWGAEAREQECHARVAEDARHEHCGAFHHGSCATDSFLRSEVARLQAELARMTADRDHWYLEANHNDIELQNFARRRAALPATLRKQDAEARLTTTTAHAA